MLTYCVANLAPSCMHAKLTHSSQSAPIWNKVYIIIIILNDELLQEMHACMDAWPGVYMYSEIKHACMHVLYNLYMQCIMRCMHNYI